MKQSDCDKTHAKEVLQRLGYNWATSDVEHACALLDHPELKPEDSENYHKWSGEYTRRCYCSMVGYTDEGRFYACDSSPEHTAIMQKIFPGWENKYGRPYP